MHDALRLPQRHECFCQTTRFDRWPLQHVTRLVAEIRYLDNTLALSHVIFRSLSLKLRGNTMPFSENYIVGSEPLGTFEQATRCERRRDTFSTALGPPTKRNNGSTFSRSILLVTAGKTCARRGNSVTPDHTSSFPETDHEIDSTTAYSALSFAIGTGDKSLTENPWAADSRWIAVSVHVRMRRRTFVSDVRLWSLDMNTAPTSLHSCILAGYPSSRKAYGEIVELAEMALLNHLKGRNTTRSEIRILETTFRLR